MGQGRVKTQSRTVAQGLPSERRLGSLAGPVPACPSDIQSWVRHALAHLHDPFYLQRHPLGGLVPEAVRRSALSGAMRGQGVSLRTELLQCIEDLRPGSWSESQVAARHYRLLVLRYEKGLRSAAISRQLAISQRQYYYDVQAAVAAVASRLADRWGLLEAESDFAKPRLHHRVENDDPGRSVSTLPTPLTSFVGREKLVAELMRTIASTRLLTLTGPPGAGKTRLALQLADAVTADQGTGPRRAAGQPSLFPDGVFRIGLAAIADPALVLPTIAQAIGIPGTETSISAESLINHLSGRQALLVLDNFEQVTRAAATVIRVAEGCPTVTLLVTSRSPLRVRGEQEFAVPPLSLPDPVQHLTTAEVARYESIRLFVARAQAQNPRFALTDANRTAIVRICSELDGLPLAIELAAARTRSLSVDQIVRRLDVLLDLLGRAGADAPPHQRGLRAALDWSWALLSANEQALLSRLSVFAGGCSLEAVAAICGFADPTDLLERLVEKSLIVVSEAAPTPVGVGGESGPIEQRYSLLEIVRQYGWEKLAATSESVRLRQAHLNWCLALVDLGDRESFDPAHLAAMEREHDNLRSALRWCVQTANAGAGFRLLRAALGLWQVRGYYSECRSWFGQLAALPDAGTPPTHRAAALATVAQIAYCQGDFDAGEEWAKESVAIFEEQADTAGAALATNVLGNLAYGRGDLRAAHQLYETARSANHRLGLTFWETASIFALSRIALVEGTLDDAQQLADEGLSLARPLGLPWITARLLRTLGHIAAEGNNCGNARTYYEEALRLQRAIGDPEGATQTLISLAQLKVSDSRKSRPSGSIVH